MLAAGRRYAANQAGSAVCPSCARLLVVGILFTYRALSLPFEVADALGVVTSDVKVTWAAT